MAKSGTFTLKAEGAKNATGQAADEFHAYFSEMGFPIGTGDTFEIDWAVNNGSGPEVYFEIHTHEHGWTRYYATNGSKLNLTWTVPRANDTFMIYWVNHWPYSVNVTYNIVDKAPPPDVTPLLILPIVVGAAFGWFLWLRAVPDDERVDSGGKPLGAESGAGADARGAEAPPTPGEADEQPALDDEAFQRAVMENESEGGGPGDVREGT